MGELALDGGTRSASVMTMEPTRCAVVSGARLRDFLAAHPDFALHLIRDLIRRVRRLTGSIKNLALEDVHHRVVALLQELSEPHGGQRIIAQKLTQQNIADHVGSSREMVSRIFKELVTGGYLRVDAGRITILKTPPACMAGSSAEGPAPKVQSSMQHIDRRNKQETAMNMNATRLGDQLNSLLVTAAVFCVLLTSALNFQARSAADAQIADANVQTLPTVYSVASR